MARCCGKVEAENPVQEDTVDFGAAVHVVDHHERRLDLDLDLDLEAGKRVREVEEAAATRMAVWQQMRRRVVGRRRRRRRRERREAVRVLCPREVRSAAAAAAAAEARCLCLYLRYDAPLSFPDDHFARPRRFRLHRLRCVTCRLSTFRPERLTDQC